MMRKQLMIPALLALSVGLAACSSQPNSNLEQARTNFSGLQADPQASKVAALETKDASDYLDKADKAYQNAKENTPHTARMAHDQALGRVMQLLLKDDTQVYKQFVENESFKRFVGDMVYELTAQ